MESPVAREVPSPSASHSGTEPVPVALQHAASSSVLDAPWDLYTERQRWSYLAVLFAVITSNYFDYFILSVVLDPIKHEFHLSDTVLGILSGTCFSVAFMVSALPIARWADRGNRRTVIISALTGWSVMTTLCGFVQSFVQLAVARFCVGLMEPGAIPPAQSLVADYFSPRRRATAITVLLNGGSAVGWLVGVGLGSYIAGRYGWRSAFLLAGLPGIALALAVRLMLPEPRCQPGHVRTQVRSESLAQVVSRLARKKSIVFCLAGVSLYTIFLYGVTVFIPSFITRSFDIPFERVGTIWGGAISVANVVGALAGGVTADHLGKRDVRWYAWLPALASAAGLPFYWLALTATDVWHFIALEFLGELALSIGIPIVVVAVLTVSGTHRRAVASAGILLSTTLFGVTLGPLLSGALSDALNPAYHAESLRYSLCVMCVFLIPAGLSFYWANRAMRQDEES